MEGGDCGGIYDGACSSQQDAIALRWPDRVRRVDLVCDLAVCDRRHGAGHALVTFGDGSIATTTWEYANPVPELPEPQCIGLDRDLCRGAYASWVLGLDPEWELADVAIRCDGVCDVYSGETTITFTLADGSTHETGYGWLGGGTLLPSQWVDVGVDAP